MKILVQKSEDRDIIGVSNALSLIHEVSIWDQNEDIREIDHVDFAIFSDTAKLGYKTFSALKKGVRIVFLKCGAPSFFKGDNGTTILSLPYCADDKRYPPTFSEKRYYCDVLAFNPMGKLSNYIDILRQVPKNFTFRVVGEPVDLPNYIGGCTTPMEVSKYCMSAGVCLDFDLDVALDLAKIGCNVISNAENTISIPVFQDKDIGEVIGVQLKKKPPVLNPYEVKIITYTQFIKYMFDTVYNRMNTQTVEVPVG